MGLCDFGIINIILGVASFKQGFGIRTPGTVVAISDWFVYINTFHVKNDFTSKSSAAFLLPILRLAI